MSTFLRVRLAGLFILLAAVLSFCMAPRSAMGQAVASITGTVTDSTGAVVPGASVKLLDTRTNTSYFGKTAGDGSYRITNLPPGPGYALTVTKDSFQTLEINNLYLPVAVATTQDVTLQLGGVSQKVEVTAQGSISLNTTDTTIGNNLDMRAVENLPNEFRDDPAQLLRLQVGVVSAQAAPGNAVSSNVDPNGTRDGSVAGADSDQNNIIVDGIDATDFAFGAAFETQAAVPVEAIQEFTTQVANPSPQYGGRGGAQTIISTKSGSNDWHGTAYEYNRTAATEADTFFNNQVGLPRLGLIRNQYGANLGGPILKDKLFFFFEFDGRRDRSQQSVLETVPFPHVKLGELAYINDSGGGTCPNTSRLTSADVSTPCVTILSAAQVASLDPCSVGACGTTSQGFAASGVDPALINLFKTRYPNPNDYSQGDGLNTAGFRFNAPDDLAENEYTSRADYNLSSSNKIFARMNIRHETGVETPNQFPGDPLTAPNVIKDIGWALADTWIINPNLVNTFTYGETRANDDDPIRFNPGENLYELTFMSGDVSNPYVRQSQIGHIVPEPTFRDDMNWTHGKHSFTFGGQWNPVNIRDFLTNDFTFIQQGIGGAITTLNSATPGLLRPADILGGVDPTEDPNQVAVSNWDGFFTGAIGVINNVQASINYNGKGGVLPPGTETRHNWRVQDTAAYFQDAWKFRPSLTVTLGVRYQFQTVPYDTDGEEATFLNTSLSQIVKTRVANGLAGISGPDATPLLTYSLAGKANHAPGLYPNEWHDISPRVGFAWNPSFSDGLMGRIVGDHKTVVRAGAAMIYDETVINSIIQLEDQGDYTFGNSFAEEFSQGDSPVTALQNDPRFTSASGVPFPIIDPPFTTPVTPSAVFNYGLNNNLTTPYSITTSLGVQRELPWGLQFEGDYYGRFSHKLLVLADAGQTIDFVDPASGQSLSQAFTVLEKDARAGLATSAVGAVPFFENEMQAGTGASCAAINAVVFQDSFTTCAEAIYNTFRTSIAQGDSGGLLFPLGGLFPANVGLTPQFIVNALASNRGNASYNAMFLTLRKRLSHNLQFDFDYTYSHAIDNNTFIANENGNFASGVTSILCDVTNPHACRGNSEFDATHSIVGDFVYDLPFGRGQQFGRDSGWLVDELIGGWQIAGIQTWRTGLALTADNGVASTTSLAADPGEDFIGPRSALARGIHIDTANNNEVQFFADPSAAIAAYTPVSGLNVGTRDNLRGPHFSNFDVAVAKNFPLWNERYSLKFVAQAFNAFNHANFGLPNPSLTSSTFGVISGLTGQEPSRVMQFALRFQF